MGIAIDFNDTYDTIVNNKIGEGGLILYEKVLTDWNRS